MGKLSLNSAHTHFTAINPYIVISLVLQSSSRVRLGPALPSILVRIYIPSHPVDTDTQTSSSSFTSCAPDFRRL